MNRTRCIVVIAGLLCFSQIHAQSVKAIHVYASDTTTGWTLEANYESLPDFNLYASEFNFPPKIIDNIRYIVDSTNNPDSIIMDVYNYHDSLGRLLSYFYQGSFVSGIEPIAYMFEYDTVNPFLISKVTDEKDQSVYVCEYSTKRNKSALTRMVHYNKEGKYIEEIYLTDY